MSDVDGATLVDDHDDLGAVDAVLDSAAGHLNAQHARLVSVAVWLLDHVAEWQGDGLWTPEAYLRWRTGVAGATAKKVVDVARRVREFPECVAAMERGELSLDQIAPIARHAPGWSDSQIAGLAPRLTVAQISNVAREYPWDGPNTDQPDQPVAADQAVEAVEAGEATDPPATVAPSDEAWFGWDDHGRFRLSVNVGADTGTVLETAITEARDTLFHAGTTDVDTVDAIVEVAHRSLDAIESPDRRHRYRINTFLTNNGQLTDQRGRPIPTGAADRITCDALLSPIHCNHDGIPVSVGRSQHIVPERTRRIVEHRDRGCRVPGCTHDRFVEVHHIVHWSDHGPTDTWNLICLCPRHHRLHHQGRLGIHGNADIDNGVRFTDANGIELAPSGTRPTPPGAPPPPTRGTWHHPVGERLNTHWLHFNDDPRRPPPIRPTPAGTAPRYASLDR